MLARKKNENDIIADIISWCKEKPYILDVFEWNNLSGAPISQPQKERMINGYSRQRSGDIQFTIKPGYFDRGTLGTTHGSWNPYDAHIPFIVFWRRDKSG